MGLELKIGEMTYVDAKRKSLGKNMMASSVENRNPIEKKVINIHNVFVTIDLKHKFDKAYWRGVEWCGVAWHGVA